MNQFTKRLAIAGVCVCMTASTLTGCGVKEDSVVATVDGDEISYALANFVIRYNQAQYEQFYTAYGAYIGLQPGTNVWEQSMDGKSTLGENLREGAMESLKDMYLLEDHMKEYDITITEEEKKAIEKAADAFLAENEPEVLEAMSANKETVSRMLELSTIYTKMQSAIYDTVDTEVSDEEAAQRGITTAFFSAQDLEDATAADASDSDAEDTATEGSAKNEAKEKAQKVLDEIKKGKDLDEVLENTDDTVTAEYLTYGEDDTTLNEDIKAAADALTKEGEAAENLVESENGYYVVQLTTTLDRDATDTKKEEIVSERQTEAFENAVAEWKEEADITVKQKTLNKIEFVDSISAVYTPEATPADATAGEASEAEAETEIATEKETETETETVTEKETETETETATETEKETETKKEKETEKE
ncbi:MAG: peptidylprolyl isomerase [Clostridiales bacterium]|nr:peptidylprolyl isomerase [Clostridiales bacterium]